MPTQIFLHRFIVRIGIAVSAAVWTALTSTNIPAGQTMTILSGWAMLRLFPVKACDNALIQPS